MDKPLISFVVPCWNRAHYLPDTIDSLLAQSLKEIEIIVVDDGSTDTTPYLMDWYVEKDKRINYIPVPHKGVGMARNIGNREAKADIIATADSDDIYHPDRAKITYKFFNRYHDIDGMYGTYLLADFWGQATYKHPIKMASEEHADKFVHSMSAFRTKVLLKEPYNEKIPYDIDGDLVRRLFKKEYRISFTKSVLGKVRYSAEGLSAIQHGVKK